MSHRPFKPTAFDALEGRLALSAFAVPFMITTTQPPGEVNPKFLVLTKRVEGQVNRTIGDDFDRFASVEAKAQAAYEKGLAKAGADPATLMAALRSKVIGALDRLNSDFDKVAHEVPFGGANLSPVLTTRIEGQAIIVDATTHAVSSSLEVDLLTEFAYGDRTDESVVIASTRAYVRADVGDYINLGVTNGYFKLGRGATLPPISQIPITP